MLTTTGTPASRATGRPNHPGLGLWVCTMSGRSRRRIWYSSAAERASSTGAMARVACGQGTWTTPRAASPAANGPGAETPMTS